MRESRINKGGEPPTPSMEAEKRIRREIANSNERRRMQSINNGFQSLRSLLPHHEGEKLSKAAILQQTAEYIYNLEQEKTRLLSQNCQLKRLVNQHEGGELPPKKRKTPEVIIPNKALVEEENPEPVSLITVSVSGPTLSSPANGESPAEIKRQLEKERSLRLILEKQVQQMEAQLYDLQQQLSQGPVYHVEENEEIALQLVAPDSLPPVGHTQTVVCSPVRSRTVSPEPEPPFDPEQRLPSVLEAAIKAEPKVEVERLPSPHAEESATPGRFLPSRSRQSLETIVEAIRHLEGDHMFGDEPQQRPQEVPLALTTRPSADHLHAEMNSFLDFRGAATLHQQQSRPGVIVVKQAS
ncbi:transcription factor AP-4 isoform X2 [Coccinella septempunctata]|uniref:transcription factor AP-4 isoform X2 n=1 Tax=Coccinella septempunctata TaxID=41139 RepID=UPI001D063C60|nr:transcription factor AP-4 isoform X2 [Coccinella septempunctata]